MSGSFLTFDNGKFLGRWEPATDCSCCFGKRISLRRALAYLSLIQLVTGLVALTARLHIFFTSLKGSADGDGLDNPPGLSEPIVDVATSCWILWGIKVAMPEPIFHYAFMQALLAGQDGVNLVTNGLYYIVSALSPYTSRETKGEAALSALLSCGYSAYDMAYKVQGG